MRLSSFHVGGALALSGLLLVRGALAQQAAPFPQGRTVYAEARKIAALVAAAPPDVRAAAAELQKAVTEQAKAIADGIRAVSMRFDAAARAAVGEAQRLLAPPMLAQKLATPGDMNGDALSQHIEAGVQAAIAHVTQALTAAKEEANKFTGAVEAALGTAKSQAEALQQRGAPLVEQVAAFIAAAKRQAARLLMGARARAQVIIGQIAQTGKQALATTAGPPKGYVQRIRGGVERLVQSVVAFAARLPAGPGKDVANQAQEKMNEAAKAFAQAIRQARATSRQGAAQIITDAYKAIDPDALAALFKEKGAQSAPDMEQKVNEVLQAATNAAKLVLGAARDAAKQAVDGAVATLSAVEIEAAKLGAQGQAIVGPVRQLVLVLRLEATRLVMRSSQGGRDSIRRAAQAAREAVAKAVGKEPPPSTGRKVAVDTLTRLAEGVPPAFREAALLAVTLVRDASRDAKEASRKVVGTAAALLARAKNDAASIVTSVQGLARDAKQATQLRSRLEGALRSTTAQYLAPLRTARATAKQMVSAAENALRKVQYATQRMGQAGVILNNQARRVTNASRREAALLVRSVRALTKAATRKLTAGVYEAFSAVLGVERPKYVTEDVLKAFQEALVKASPAVRKVALPVEAMMAKQRAAMRAANARESKALRAARKLARTAMEPALNQLLRDIKSPAFKTRPALLGEAVAKMTGQTRATVMAVVTQAKKNATAFSLALKNEAAQVARILSAGDGETRGLASIARQFYDELRARTARQLLLIQQRAKEGVRKVVTAARQKVGGIVPGGLKKRAETLRLVRELAKVIRSAPPAVKNAVSGPLSRAVALAKKLAEATAAVVKRTDAALKSAEAALRGQSVAPKGTSKSTHTKGATTKAAPAKVAPVSLDAALSKLGEDGRAVVADTKTRATELSDGADALAKDADEAAEKSTELAMKKATDGFKALASALKRDAVRLLLTAKTRATSAIAWLESIAKTGAAKPAVKPRKAPATKTRPATPAKGVPGKRAGRSLTVGRVAVATAPVSR